MSAVMRLPEVLTGMEEAVLTNWHVEIGQQVEVGQPLADVETEKATVEHVSDVAGVVAELLVATEVPIQVGTPIVLLATDGESVEQARAGSTGPDSSTNHEDVAASDVDKTVPRSSESQASAAPDRLRATPLVRRLARQHDIDLTGVAGTGPGGRIVRRDVERLVKGGRADEHRPVETAPETHPSQTSRTEAPSTEAAAPEPASAQTAATPAGSSPSATGGPGLAIPHSRMRRAIARRLSESKATVPHFYLTAHCRVDALLRLRAQINEDLEQKISVNDFVVKAVAGALQDVPEMNAQWTDDAVLRPDAVDVAVAVALKDGLVTPVVRHAASRSVVDISRTIRDLAERARAGTLRQADLERGTFSISNLGMYGIEQFAAIINPPHAGILAVGAATERPIVVDGRLEVGTVMTVTLSGDHRVVDGATGAQWLGAFVRRVEAPLMALA